MPLKLPFIKMPNNVVFERPHSGIRFSKASMKFGKLRSKSAA